MTLPSKGGSYVRKADGTLERVAGTERRAPARAEKSAAPLAPPALPPSDPTPAPPVPTAPAGGKKGEK